MFLLTMVVQAGVALRNLPNVRGSRYQVGAATQRDNLKIHFTNTGVVEWKVNMLLVTGLL